MAFSPKSPVLRVVGVTKRFPGVVALDKVSLELYPGEILSLLGENGSGKSTLAKVIAGIYAPDEGFIEVSGRSFSLLSPVEAISYGILYVPQSPSLIDELTVAENLLIALRSYGMMTRVGDVEGLVVRESQSMGLRIDPRVEVGRLSYTQKQIVELMKASLVGAKVLIIDEVTTYLPRSIREKFYEHLERLRREGKTVLLITHKIPEAVEVADRITVMRSGRVVRTLGREEFDVELIRGLMFGDGNIDLNPPHWEESRGEPSRDRRPVIQLDDVWALGESGNHALRGVRISVKPGEVLGVVGISGNGQRELFEVLAGLRTIERGRYYLDGVDITNRGPKAVRSAGVGLITEAPLYYSLSGDLSLVENMALIFRGCGPLFSLRSLAAKTKELMERYRVVAASPNVKAKVLSGGNVMKFAIARELEFSRRALIALNPMRSLDERSASYFVDMLRRRAKVDGLSVVYISESLDEVLRISDAVAVISGGRIVGTFSRWEVERETLEKLMVM